MLKFTITDLLDPDSLQIIQEGFSRFTGLNSLVTDTSANPVTEGNDFSDFISKILVYNEDANEPVLKKEIVQILRSGKTITLKNESGSCDAASPLLLEGDLIGLFICGAGSEGGEKIKVRYVNPNMNIVHCHGNCLWAVADVEMNAGVVCQMRFSM